jgi:hypothetical protein
VKNEQYIAQHGWGEDALLQPIIDAIIDGGDMDHFLRRLATYMVCRA